MTICPKDKCTACGACRDVCPRQCISFVADKMDELHPYIDTIKCVECGLCRKVCPNNTTPKLYYPRKVYAAWSNKLEFRRNSASGGIASELYKNALSTRKSCVGVVFDKDKGAVFKPIESELDIPYVRNSKYTFSNTDGIYKYVRSNLNEDKDVLFIGLPCQVAGLLNFLNKSYEKLTTVDIICHGVAPQSYIKQHIENIETRLRRKATSIYFRDPKKQTHLFYFSMYDQNKCFYSKKATAPDIYQLGYHKALIYRDNCYKCQYAQASRVADLTIGDFSGVGRDALWEFGSVNVSCILVNTLKGEQTLNEISNQVTYYERPISEALNYEKQLKSPSIPHPCRMEFKKKYQECGSFVESAHIALAKDLKKARRAQLSPKQYIRRFVTMVTTPQMRKIVRNFIRKF